LFGRPSLAGEQRLESPAAAPSKGALRVADGTDKFVGWYDHGAGATPPPRPSHRLRMDYSAIPLWKEARSHSVRRGATLKINRCRRPPIIGTLSLTPNPVVIGAAVQGTAPFSDAGLLDQHSATWTGGDGTSNVGASVVPASHLDEQKN
jgi:hypothetical protein